MSSSVLDILYDVRNRIESIPDEKYNNAFKYQYLIGGDAGEVSGRNAPMGSDASLVSYTFGRSKIEAVIFTVKTVRRINHYRACVLPKVDRYDPWVSDVYEWFQKYPDSYPFRFKRKDKTGLLNADTSKTYIMNRAKEIFSGLSWFKEGYVTTKRKQDRRDVDFTSSQLRDLRLAILSEQYGFDETDLAKFGAWNVKSYNESINVQVENILRKKIPKDEMGTFYEIGRDYLFKLLIPFEDLPKLNRRFEVDDTARLARYYRAGQMLLDIEKINTWSGAKLNGFIFKENMMATYDIMNDCDNENHFKTKITNLEKLFDVKLAPFRKLVKDPPEDAGSIILLQMWLEQNEIDYDKNMIQTWLYINKLRNNLLHIMKPKEYMAILNYFGVELKDPINYSLLWENILLKFQESLTECFSILNECKVYS